MVVIFTNFVIPKAHALLQIRFSTMIPMIFVTLLAYQVNT